MLKKEENGGYNDEQTVLANTFLIGGCRLVLHDGDFLRRVRHGIKIILDLESEQVKKGKEEYGEDATIIPWIDNDTLGTLENLFEGTNVPEQLNNTAREKLLKVDACIDDILLNNKNSGEYLGSIEALIT